MADSVIGTVLTRAVSAEANKGEDALTVNLSFSSETPYHRSDLSGRWIEVLGHRADEVDMTFISGGSAPLLWDHDRFSRNSILGVVESAKIDGKRGTASVRFSARADVAGAYEDVINGVVRNVSVGYKVLERKLTRKNSDGVDEYRVTKWQPMEISLVTIPADTSVGVGRSDDVVEIKPGEPKMGDETVLPAGPAVPELTRGDIDQAVARERVRVADITELSRRHGLDADFADKHIRAGDPIESVRAAALDILATRTSGTMPRVEMGVDEAAKTADAAAEWLSHRSGLGTVTRDNPCRGMSVLDIARTRLAIRGDNVIGLTASELVTRAITHSASDFLVVLENVMNKTLLASFTATPDTWREFCAVGSVTDFRPHYRYRMGSFGNLEAVAENGKFTHGTLSDAERESISAGTKGKLLNFSRQMLINDDMGAFSNVVQILGRSAARSIEADVYALLAANPVTGDGGALFNSTVVTTAGGHANITAYAAPSVAMFDTVRQAMSTQRDIGANDFVTVSPSVWLGPVALKGTASVVNDSQYDIDQTSKTSFYPNKSRGLFQKVIDSPRLSGNVWYAFANPSENPVIEVAFLNGQQTPVTEAQQGFEVDGVTWKVRLDYGVAAVGWRGAHKVV